MHHLVKLGQKHHRPILSKSKLHGRFAMRVFSSMLGLICLLAFSLQRIQMKSEIQGQLELRQYSEILHTTHRIMINFRWMVQNWKNTLIRGHDPKDREKYWKEVLDLHQKNVQEIDLLLEQATADHTSLIKEFRTHENNLLNGYSHALTIAQASPTYDYRAADTAVRGLDRRVLDPLDKLEELARFHQQKSFDDHFKEIQKIQEYGLISFVLIMLGIWLFAFYFVKQKVKKEERLETQNSKMQELGRMAANIVHEIKNPITIIEGRCQQIEKSLRKEDFANQQTILHQVQSISKVNNRLVKIIQSMSRYSRFTEDLPLSPIHLEEIIEDVNMIVRSRFVEYDVTLDIDPQASGSGVLCRDIEISQILVNLLINAADAVHNLEQRWVRLQVIEKDDALEFIVEDSGNGIPADILDKMSKQFFTTKEIGKGTGQGIHLSKRIIEEHEGYFYYDDTSKHTRFVIGLPKKSNAVVANSPHSPV